MPKSPMQFDHVGIPTTEKKPGMTFVPATRVWITEAHHHPYRVEWLRYEPDSPVTGPLHDQPHVGFRVQKVEQIAELSKGMKVLLEPFDAGFAVAGFYQTADGANIELVWYRTEPKV
jgi:glyoxylase I family protein